MLIFTPPDMMDRNSSEVVRKWVPLLGSYPTIKAVTFSYPASCVNPTKRPVKPRMVIPLQKGNPDPCGGEALPSLIEAKCHKHRLTRACSLGQWMESWMRVPSVICREMRCVSVASTLGLKPNGGF